MTNDRMVRYQCFALLWTDAGSKYRFVGGHFITPRVRRYRNSPVLGCPPGHFLHRQLWCVFYFCFKSSLLDLRVPIQVESHCFGVVALLCLSLT